MEPSRLLAVALACFALAGCATTDTGVTRSLKPVCSALVGPLKYSSTNHKSHRFAGSDLAPELKRRNDVGSRLGCPQYR